MPLHASSAPRATGEEGLLRDSFGRVMRDLRISLTDRCNFRCLYCLPETEEAANFYRSKFDAQHNPSPKPLALPPLKPRSEILSYEEIERLARVFVACGIRKVRLTGGEPLLRHDLEKVVGAISALREVEDLAITTNGFLFPQKGRALAAAGLKRISISLDSLDAENFKKLTGRDGLRQALQSIELARELRLHPIKINAVIIRGLNDHEIAPLAEFAQREQLIMRFIEFMPLDAGRAWMKELVVSGREIQQRLAERFTLSPLPNAPAETARRWRFENGAGEIGIIAPVSEPFCGHCNRLRLTADGQLRTCLFSHQEHDLKGPLRNGACDAELAELLRSFVLQKEAGHKIGREEFVQPKRSMSCIGG